MNFCVSFEIKLLKYTLKRRVFVGDGVWFCCFFDPNNHFCPRPPAAVSSVWSNAKCSLLPLCPVSSVSRSPEMGFSGQKDSSMMSSPRICCDEIIIVCPQVEQIIAAVEHAMCNKNFQSMTVEHEGLNVIIR